MPITGKSMTKIDMVIDVVAGCAGTEAFRVQRVRAGGGTVGAW